MPASALSLELGKVEMKVFDPDSLDPHRCESCYGAETEDIKWARPWWEGKKGEQGCLSAFLGLSLTLWQVWKLDHEFRGDGVYASVTDPGYWCECQALPADLGKRLKWSLLWFRDALQSPTAWLHPCVLGPSHRISLVNGDDQNTFLIRVTSGLNMCTRYTLCKARKA